MKTRTVRIIIFCIIMVTVISGIVIKCMKRTYSVSYAMGFQASRLYVDTDGKTRLEIEYEVDGSKYSKDLLLEINNTSLAYELDADNVEDIIGGQILLNVPQKELRRINPDYQYTDTFYYLCNDLLNDYMVIASLDFQ